MYLTYLRMYVLHIKMEDYGTSPTDWNSQHFRSMVYFLPHKSDKLLKFILIFYQSLLIFLLYYHQIYEHKRTLFDEILT